MSVAIVSKTDMQLKRDVEAELQYESRVNSTEIGVAVKDGVVTLAGWVDSYAKRSYAAEATHRVRGVKAVANEIEVRLPASAERTDVDIAKASAQALEWDSTVNTKDLDVTVTKGWVTLKGTVNWAFERENAERAVQNLKGVNGVTNLIAIKPQIVPGELKRKIEEALVRSAHTDSGHIFVAAIGSHVTLSGTVRSYAEKLDAGRAAWAAPGVTTVDNRITVAS